MQSTYAGKQQISIGRHRISRNSSASYQENFELDKVIAHLNSRDHIVFQRIVDSIKFGVPQQSEMLANELCKIRLLKAKLLLIQKLNEKIR